jgi:hypothetical protein
VQEIIGEQVSDMVERIGYERFTSGWYPTAVTLLENLMTGVEFPEFLTLVAYDYLD